MSPLQPWIQEYLIGVAEQYGVDYFNAPPHARQKTVQIIEFLHRGIEGQETNIWARVSDSVRFMTARFSPEAAAECERLHGRRLTQQQTAIIRIKDFKLFFARVPVRGGSLTPSETLVLECNSVTLHGSVDEKRVGNPQNVTLNQDIKGWIEGLRQGGGNGNILKQRRLEREKSRPMNNSDNKVVVSVLEQQKLETVVRRPTTVREPRTKTTKTAPTNAREQPWKPQIPSLYEIPLHILATLRALPIEGEEATALSSKCEKDTNGELESPRKKRRIDNDEDSNDMDIDDDEHDGRSSQPVSGWSASESEGEKELKPEQQPLVPVSPPTGLQQVPVQQQSPTSHRSPPSSLPPMSSYAKMEAPLSPSKAAPKLPPSQDPRLRVRRKVPPPKQPQELTQGSGQGERVLAPASDTSMSQSQSQSQSQSRKPHNGHKPGSSPMRGWEGEDERLVQQTTNRGATRQVARKTSFSGQLNRDMISSQQRNKVKSHESSDSEAKRVDGMSGDVRKVISVRSPAQVEKLRSAGWELPQSKEDDNNRTRARPNGLQPVSTSVTAISQMETRVHHDPETWSEPSFMGKLRTFGKDVGEKGRVNGVEEQRELAWLSWKELGRILEATYMASCR